MRVHRLLLVLLLVSGLARAQDAPSEEKVYEWSTGAASIPSEEEQQKKIDKEESEYFAALATLNSKIETDQSRDSIKQAIASLLEESDDISEAVLNDKNAFTLRKTVQSYPYALLVDAGYHFGIDKVPHYERMDREEFPEAWRRWFIDKTADKKYPLGKGMLLNYPDASMWVAAFKRDDSKEIVLVFRGAELRPTYVKDFARNARTVAEHWAGTIPLHFEKAFELAKAMHEKYPNKELVITGSSLGGSLSMFTGLALGTRVYAFNSLGLNPKEIDFIGKHNADAFENADAKVTIVSITGDMASDSSEILPKSFVNSYFGTVLKIPFHDNSWTGYYGSTHHTSDAIVKSLQYYLKSELMPYGKRPSSDNEYHIDVKAIVEELADDEVRVINRSGRPVKVIAFPCTADGLNKTSCDESMFRYPHGNFGLNVSSWTNVPLLSTRSDKPIVRSLNADDKYGTTIRLPKLQQASWPKDYFWRNKWVYVTALNPSVNCRLGDAEPYRYLGKPYYSGVWPSTLAGGKSLGWLRPESNKNPKILVVTNFNSNDICSYGIEGM